jgi:hypothetical protein
MAVTRLTEAERTALEARRRVLESELKMLTAELRSDAVLRVARGRPTLEPGRRSEYLRKLYGDR